MARGFMARRYFRRLKASYVIVQHYRRYKRRTYINELKDTFKDANNMSDYGKRLPWPKENYAVKSVIPLLKMMYARWYSWMILRRIPRDDWPQLRLKVNGYFNATFIKILNRLGTSFNYCLILSKLIIKYTIPYCM
jgi:myosin-1